MTTAAERLDRALISLDGLSVGDAFGEYGFVRNLKPDMLPNPPWRFTDDTNMALSIVATLRRYEQIDQDALASSFARHFDGTRGYAAGMIRLLHGNLAGQDWREAAKMLFRGEGSYGNGSAMRVAPLGAYFADDLAQAAQEAARSAEVTHAHPEGIAGAVAIAVGAAVAWQTRGEKITRGEFIDRVLVHIPESEVRSRVKIARDTTLTAADPIEGIVSMVGNGGEVTAQDTVAFCLWCAGEAGDDYTRAFFLTASGGGDVDTNCAIVGGVLATRVGRGGIPAAWLERREALPGWLNED